MKYLFIMRFLYFQNHLLINIQDCQDSDQKYEWKNLCFPFDPFTCLSCYFHHHQNLPNQISVPRLENFVWKNRRDLSRL